MKRIDPRSLMGNSWRRHKEFGVEIRKRRTLVTAGSLWVSTERDGKRD
jgi:hypothetical protein